MSSSAGAAATVNPFSLPCLLVSSLATAGIVTIVSSSYAMGTVDPADRGSARFLSSTSWLSVGCCLAMLAAFIVKFVE